MTDIMENFPLIDTVSDEKYMEVIALEKLPSETADNEIINIEFDIDTLIITVEIESYKLDIYIDDPAGFRVLDEGDLLEFWPTCSSHNGWLYEIKSSGWLEQESKRKGFLLSQDERVKEYFITGTNFCINVLSWEPPRIEESIR